MRYVEVNSLNENMTVGQNLYKNNQLIVRAGAKVTEKLRNSLTQLGFAGIFIKDKWSEGTEDNIEGLFDRTIINNMTTCIKELFTLPHEKTQKVKDKENSLMTLLTENYLNDLINEIFSNSITALNLYDLKTYDDYTFYHSVNVALFSAVCAKEMGYSRDAVKEVALTGLLHDIGKKDIPIEILNKPGPLTDAEREVMSAHPRLGLEYVKQKCPHFSCKITTGIYEHHERCDGSGYPRGVTGDKICDYAKIVTVADVYDALTSKRAYRDAYLPSEAIEYLVGNIKDFDISVVSAFIKCIYAYPIGTLVELSNGKRGIVIAQNPDFNVRPFVRLLDEDKIVNLFEEIDITIVKILKDMDM